jgi:hypothetical protein
MRTTTRIAVTMMTLVLAIAGAAWAKDEQPAATLKLETKEVSVGIGWSWGSGTITYKGAKHRFKIDGLTLNAVGAAKSDATGYVYNLKKLSDFAGTYTSIEAGGSAGGGKSIATIKNQNGVRLTIHSTSEGIEVIAGPEGMKISLEK